MPKEENGLSIYKANSFVQNYKFSLSMVEIRIINYLIANIHSPKFDTKFNKFKFDIHEFCSIVYPEKKQGDAYKRLPNIIRNLSDKSAWKEVPSDVNPGKMKKVLVRWIERPEFDEGFVTMELNPYLAPYLLGLENSYFKSQFQYTVEARSKYTIPLYEVLKSWEKVKDHTKTFEIDELKIYMDATSKSQKNTYEFKRTALDPAIEEINRITDLTVSYEEIKKGRKVTHIKFTILHKKKQNESADQIVGQMDLETDFPEYCPDSDQTAGGQNEVLESKFALWSEACKGEFSRPQLEELALLAEGHVEYDPERHDLDIYHYLLRKYKSLQNKKDVKSRFGYMKYLVENDV